jgi:hypothetical protein
MAQEIDVNDILSSLGSQIANLTIQNASLQAQVVAYQKAEAEAAAAEDSSPPLSVVKTDD